MITRENIGGKIRELRKARGLTQQQLAERVGLSRPAISNIEQGNRALTLATLNRFCEALNVDASVLLEGNVEDIDVRGALEALFGALSPEGRDNLYMDITELYFGTRDAKKGVR